MGGRQKATWPRLPPPSSWPGPRGPGVEMLRLTQRDKGYNLLPMSNKTGSQCLTAPFWFLSGIPCPASDHSARVYRGPGMPSCKMSHLPGHSWDETVMTTRREAIALEEVRRGSATPAFPFFPGTAPGLPSPAHLLHHSLWKLFPTNHLLNPISSCPPAPSVAQPNLKIGS